ncbi:tRNA pseudouridine(65) synthase TruC [Gallibacterium trehalosifermentans]|uniref:tRNA pseudouridine synthase C n=1 Tax=Gallibacterium trehalosifermentans TaxID=516935 RepID=A0ABV6H0S5_9PAST
MDKQPLEILYQDEFLIAVNKPAGMLVHRSWLDKHETEFVMQTLRDQIGQYVFPIHRLDRPTSGVLLFALSSEVAAQVCLQFESKQVEKHYLAVVRGYLTGSDRIDYALKPKLDKIADKFTDPNKAAQPAISDYQGLATIELPIAVGRYSTARYSLVRLTPQTGRKHQLRRHLKHIFHPIIGDTQYGDLHQNRAFAEYFSVSRLMLHSETLRLFHPVTQQKLEIVAPLDQNFLKIKNIFYTKL